MSNEKILREYVREVLLLSESVGNQIDQLSQLTGSSHEQVIVQHVMTDDWQRAWIRLQKLYSEGKVDIELLAKTLDAILRDEYDRIRRSMVNTDWEETLSSVVKFITGGEDRKHVFLIPAGPRSGLLNLRIYENPPNSPWEMMYNELTTTLLRHRSIRECARELISESHFPIYAQDKMRIHHSREGTRSDTGPQISGFSQNVGRKPNGLWYECQDGSAMGWRTFCDTSLSTKYSKRYDSTYNIVLKDDGYYILHITDAHYFDKFTKMYGIPHPAMPHIPEENLIDWPKVAEHYSGIEICPHIDKRREVSWYYGWDVASGCVWSQQGIQEIGKIKC